MAGSSYIEGLSPSDPNSILRHVPALRPGANAVYKEDCSLTTTVFETRTDFAQKFACMLGGEITELVSVLTRELPSFYHTLESDAIPLELLPSYLDTLRLLKQSAPGRGLGPDFLGGELLKFGALEICRLIYPALIRADTQISPALQLKSRLMF